MRVFIVYCHPSEDSFTKNMCDAFIRGITDSGNEYIISDLYKMGFQTDMTEEEYLRDANYRDTPEVGDDVLDEQNKINSSDAIVFIYPVFWTEAPAKQTGFVVFDNTSRENELREKNWDMNIQKAYEMGKGFF